MNNENKGISRMKETLQLFKRYPITEANKLLLKEISKTILIIFEYQNKFQYIR